MQPKQELKDLLLATGNMLGQSLYSAIYVGDRETISTLLREVDVAQKISADMLHSLSIHFAQHKEQDDILKYFLKNIKEKIPPETFKAFIDNSGGVIARIALSHECTKVAKYLINNGCDIDIANDDISNLTILDMAVCLENIEIVKALAERFKREDRKPKPSEPLQLTTLHYAYLHPNPEVRTALKPLNLSQKAVAIYNGQQCRPSQITAIEEQAQVKHKLPKLPVAEYSLDLIFCRGLNQYTKAVFTGQEEGFKKVIDIFYPVLLEHLEQIQSELRPFFPEKTGTITLSDIDKKNKDGQEKVVIAFINTDLSREDQFDEINRIDDALKKLRSIKEKTVNPELDFTLIVNLLNSSCNKLGNKCELKYFDIIIQYFNLHDEYAFLVIICNKVYTNNQFSTVGIEKYLHLAEDVCNEHPDEIPALLKYQLYHNLGTAYRFIDIQRAFSYFEVAMKYAPEGEKDSAIEMCNIYIFTAEFDKLSEVLQKYAIDYQTAAAIVMNYDAIHNTNHTPNLPTQSSLEGNLVGKVVNIDQIKSYGEKIKAAFRENKGLKSILPSGDSALPALYNLLVFAFRNVTEAKIALEVLEHSYATHPELRNHHNNFLPLLHKEFIIYFSLQKYDQAFAVLDTLNQFAKHIHDGNKNDLLAKIISQVNELAFVHYVAQNDRENALKHLSYLPNLKQALFLQLSYSVAQNTATAEVAHKKSDVDNESKVGLPKTIEMFYTMVNNGDIPADTLTEKQKHLYWQYHKTLPVGKAFIENQGASWNINGKLYSNKVEANKISQIEEFYGAIAEETLAVLDSVTIGQFQNALNHGLISRAVGQNGVKLHKNVIQLKIDRDVRLCAEIYENEKGQKLALFKEISDHVGVRIIIRSNAEIKVHHVNSYLGHDKGHVDLPAAAADTHASQSLDHDGIVTGLQSEYEVAVGESGHYSDGDYA